MKGYEIPKNGGYKAGFLYSCVTPPEREADIHLVGNYTEADYSSREWHEKLYQERSEFIAEKNPECFAISHTRDLETKVGTHELKLWL